MKIAYIVSMFPCWSETFVLNEILDHHRSGEDVYIYSLKTHNEDTIHDDALPFIQKTLYPYSLFDPRLWLLHIYLLFTSPMIYTSTLLKILSLRVESMSVKLKAILTFLLSPKFIRETEDRGIDHIHAHFATYPALLAWVIKGFTDTSFSVTCHAHDIYVSQDILPLILKEAEGVVTISEFNREFLIKKVGIQYKDKIRVIHCGIDMERFVFAAERSLYKGGKDTLDILSIGRLSGIKGFPYLLNALRLLKDDGVRFYCRIIGDGPLRDSLIKQAKGLGLDGCVEFAGAKKVEEIPLFLNRADVFVLASATDDKEGHDGIPVVFMEAMACGTPVIGTRISGIPELIIHRKTGLCVEPEAPVHLKKAFKYIIENQDEVNRMRYEARAFVEKEFNVERTCRELRELFSRIIRDREKESI